MTGAVVLSVHVVGTGFMCGLAWIVQVVHYPLFDRVERAGWTDFHREHSRRIGWVVGVPWTVEGLGAFGLLVWRPHGVGIGVVVAAIVLAGITVAATVVWALPAHERLAAAFSADSHRRLVVTNWVRTMAWTAAAIVAMVMVIEVARP